MVTKEQFFWGIVVVGVALGRIDATGAGLVINFIIGLVAAGFFLYESFYVDRDDNAE